MKTRFAAWFGIVTGVSMLAQWAVFTATGNVPELASEPVRIGFHLAGEALTAILLLASGVGLLARRRRARSAFLVAAGMLLYTAIASPGYFAQQGAWAFLAMFGLVLVLALAAILSVAGTDPAREKPDR